MKRVLTILLRKGKVISFVFKKRVLTMFKFHVLWLLCTSKDNAHVMVLGHALCQKPPTRLTKRKNLAETRRQII
jgi:hypothetical protein